MSITPMIISLELSRTVILKASFIFKAFFTDLIPTLVREILLTTYHPRGETPWDPVCLFRSYWLLLLADVPGTN